MPRPRKLIKASAAAEMLDCSSKTVKRMPFKRYPLNPDSKRTTWMFEEMEIKAFLEDRLQQGRGA